MKTFIGSKTPWMLACVAALSGCGQQDAASDLNLFTQFKGGYYNFNYTTGVVSIRSPYHTDVLENCTLGIDNGPIFDVLVSMPNRSLRGHVNTTTPSAGDRITVRLNYANMEQLARGNNEGKVTLACADKKWNPQQAISYFRMSFDGRIPLNGPLEVDQDGDCLISVYKNCLPRPRLPRIQNPLPGLVNNGQQTSNTNVFNNGITNTTTAVNPLSQAEQVQIANENMLRLSNFDPAEQDAPKFECKGADTKWTYEVHGFTATQFFNGDTVNVGLQGTKYDPIILVRQNTTGRSLDFDEVETMTSANSMQAALQLPVVNLRTDGRDGGITLKWRGNSRRFGQNQLDRVSISDMRFWLGGDEPSVTFSARATLNGTRVLDQTSTTIECEVM